MLIVSPFGTRAAYASYIYTRTRLTYIYAHSITIRQTHAHTINALTHVAAVCKGKSRALCAAACTDARYSNYKCMLCSALLSHPHVVRVDDVCIIAYVFFWWKSSAYFVNRAVGVLPVN